MAQKRDGLYKRGRFWWIRTDPVTGKARSTYCGDIEAARRFRAKRERLAADPAHAAAETARLDEWIRRVIAVKESDGSSAATVEVYRTKLGHWLRLAPDAMLSQVDPTFVDAFVAQRRTEHVTDHTISKEVTHLCTVLKAAKRAGCYAGDIATLRPPDLHTGYVPRERALTREELLPLLEQLKPELRAVVAVAVALGCRLAEVYRLEPADIDWDASIVRIRGTKTTASARRVPLLSLFRPILSAASVYLPLGSEPNNLHRDIKRACARAGITEATPNDFRRTHATLLSEAGVDADVTRRLLGHTTRLLVDRIYARPRPEALGALAEAKLLTAAPLTESPRHVAPEGESNGSNGLRFRTETTEARASNLPSGVERERNVARATNSRRALKNDPAVHLHENGGRAASPVACQPNGHAVNRLDGGDEVALHQRDSDPPQVLTIGEEHRADFEIRTRDLRFTKPVREPLSKVWRRFPLLCAGELLRSGAYDDRKGRVAVTSTRQLAGSR